MPKPHYTIDDALYLMQRLRDPVDGCPWDLQQDFKDITKYTLEECYELVDALESEDFTHVEEELGDVLFQVIFYSQIASEQQRFNFESVIDKLVTKLVRRHPHVFPERQLRQRYGHQPKATEAIKTAWEATKAEERAGKQQGRLLDDVPMALPALSRAQKLQKRAAKVGMDWSQTQQVINALKAEITELEQAIQQQSIEAIAEEAGDVLFAGVNVLRHLNLDAEQALRGANHKFYQRICTVEQLAAARGENLAELDETQLEQLWQQAKTKLKADH